MDANDHNHQSFLFVTWVGLKTIVKAGSSIQGSELCKACQKQKVIYIGGEGGGKFSLDLSPVECLARAILTTFLEHGCYRRIYTKQRPIPDEVSMGWLLIRCVFPTLFTNTQCSLLTSCAYRSLHSR